MDKLLIIEDDSGIRTILRLALRSAGFTNLCEADRGDAGLDAVLRKRPALVLLDLMLPGLDGFSVCRRIRETAAVAATPVIILSAKSAEEEIVRGLECGATDYVTKPFSKAILIARIKAALRRPAAPTDALRTLDDLTLDTTARTVSVAGALPALTRSEFDLLHLLLNRPGRVYTRQQILAAIQSDSKAVTDRTVDTLMVGLRRKLGAWAVHIETIRGIGYRITP